MARVEIDLTNRGRNAEPVKVDGKVVNDVTSLSLSADVHVHGIPYVTLEVLATDGYVRIDETDVEITPHVRVITRSGEVKRA